MDLEANSILEEDSSFCLSSSFCIYLFCWLGGLFACFFQFAIQSKKCNQVFISSIKLLSAFPCPEGKGVCWLLIE